MAKLVNEGEHRIADILFGSQAVDTTLYIGLYTAPTTEPSETAVLADLTEHSGDGYARIALSRGTWTVLNSVASYAEQTFDASGGDWGNCYGYFIATSSDGSGKLMFIEQFSDGPYDVSDGDSIKITPNITLS